MTRYFNAGKHVMATRNRIPGSHEIWRQKDGVGAEFVIALHSRRDVVNFLTYRAEQERKYGYRIRENEGGFTAYTRKRDGKRMAMNPQVHYWFEEVMHDDAKIDAALLDAFAIAMATAGAEVRARSDAE